MNRAERGCRRVDRSTFIRLFSSIRKCANRADLLRGVDLRLTKVGNLAECVNVMMVNMAEFGGAGGIA